MAKINMIEADVDEIRDRIMERDKNLTTEQRIKRVNEQAERLSIQYGFKIGKPEGRINTRKAI